jgi:hypothetical protein
LVLDSRLLEVEIAIAKLKKRKSPGSNQIPSEPIEARGEVLRSSINLFKLFGIRKNNLIYAMCPLLYQLTRKAKKLTVVIIVRCHWY